MHHEARLQVAFEAAHGPWPTSLMGKIEVVDLSMHLDRLISAPSYLACLEGVGAVGKKCEDVWIDGNPPCASQITKGIEKRLGRIVRYLQFRV